MGECAVVSLLAVSTSLLAWQPSAQACSRILWNDNGLAVVVGRTMDWPQSIQPVLTVLPRGMNRDVGRAGAELVVKDSSAQ